MKKIILHFFLLLSTLAYSQKNENQRINYNFVKIFEIEGVSKEKLKENANAWLVKNFTNTNNGIKLNSGENLIARGTFEGVFRDGLGTKIPCDFDYIIEISFKENKYRVVISQYEIRADDTKKQWLANWSILYHLENEKEFIEQQKSFYENNRIFGYKSMIKRIQNPKKTKKEIKRHKKYTEVVKPQILLHQEKISKSLFEYLKNKKTNDW